jgi:hypothetical protein
MNTFGQPFPALGCAPLAVWTAAFEVLGYLGVVGIGALCFVLGWLSPRGAVVLTTLLLASLVILAWYRFDQGRHPCFLLLCSIMFIQGGGLLAYCLGAGNDPLRVEYMAPNPFYVSRDEAGIALFSLVLASICIYAPCRWNYRRIPPPNMVKVRPYLPYLYLLFFLSLPIQLFKNYRYYQYIQEHGGYEIYFVNHLALTASVPFLARIIPLITFPALIAIFVFEPNGKRLFLVTVLYFSSASFILLLGSKVEAFTLVPALWYIARIKSTKPARILKMVAIALLLLMVAEAINRLRAGEEVITPFSPLKVLATQTDSFNVTEILVKYRKIFSPYALSYPLLELRDAFVSNDASNYYRGRSLGLDVPVFLNPSLLAQGFGTGSSFIGEEYVIGGLAGVIIISVLIGFGLHLAHRFSRNALSLFVVALLLQQILVLPRNGLLDWASVLMRNAISIVLLGAGWLLYNFLSSTLQKPVGDVAAAADKR